MRYVDLPTHAAVVATLGGMNMPASAAELCDRLSSRHPRRSVQLVIQRCMENGEISVGRDWRLSLPPAGRCHR